MNCFFKIWSTRSFWCRDPANKLVNLPLSVQAELRHIARKALESLEHDVLKQLDDCLAQQGPLRPQEKMAIWASMWQLILMYRDLLAALKVHISRIQGAGNDPTIGNESSHRTENERALICGEQFLQQRGSINGWLRRSSRYWQSSTTISSGPRRAWRCHWTGLRPRAIPLGHVRARGSASMPRT